MKWILKKPRVKPNKDASPVEQIASIRGLNDVDKFLNPSKEELHDPYLMKNIEDASNRIIKAIANDERICLSYDADADGITSTSVKRRYLGNYTEKVDYIYNERSHGHGIHEQTRLDFVTEKDLDENGEIFDEDKFNRYDLNSDNLKKISKSDLLIIIDSSSNDTEACKKLVEDYGVDIIILDHHAIEKENPYALIVNPQQDGCEYPNKHLSGAGVVFKTIQVMEDTLNSVDVWQYIDLVAVGMYADMMKMDVPENRYLVMHGLRNVKNTGLIRILKGAKADLYKLNGDSIGFSIAPMINGVARLDNIKLAIDILFEDDDKLCKPIRLKMQKLNEKRKEMQKEIVERYMKNIDDNKKILIVMDDESSKGFNGLVAQQLTEKYKRPVIVGRIHNGVLSGSFRSYNGFKLKNFLQQFGEDIEALGHEMAGGIVIKGDKLPLLETYINRHMPSLEDTEPTVLYDLEISVDEIGEYINEIERFNFVTGGGFPKIVVRINGIAIEEAECIGKTRETVKIKTFDDVELIKFRVNDKYASELGYFDMIDVVGTLGWNEFYNFGLKKLIRTSQVMIEDYALS